MASAEETHIFQSAVGQYDSAGGQPRARDINLPVSGDTVATNSALAVAPGAKAPPQIGGLALQPQLVWEDLTGFCTAGRPAKPMTTPFESGDAHDKIWICFERMLYNVLEQLSPNGRLNNYGSLAALLTNSPTKLNALAPGHSFEVAIRESLLPGTFKTIGACVRILRSTWACVMRSRHCPKMPTTESRKSRPSQTVLRPGVAAGPNSPCGPVHVNSFIANNPRPRTSNRALVSPGSVQEWKDGRKRGLRNLRCVAPSL